MKHIALLFLMLLGTSFALAAPWETLPPDHWAYPEIRWLQVEGYLGTLNPSSGIYRRGEIAEALKSSEKPEGGVALARFKSLVKEFSPEMDQQKGWHAFGGGRLIAGLEARKGREGREAGHGAISYGVGNPVLGIYSSQRGDRDLTEDSFYTGKKWRDLTGFTEAAYLVFTTKRWEAKIGRDHLAWGPGDDHLILNYAPRGLDQISFKVHWRWGQFSALIGQVSDFVDTTGERSSRFLSGHRLEIAPWPWLRLGFSETLLFSSLRFGSMNPFLPYYGELVNENSEGNGLLGFDFSAFPARDIQAYGELLLDDAQFENKTPKDLEPAQWGWLIGLRWAGLSGLLGAGISYQGITNRTYNAIEPQYRYTNYGLALGSDLGNDADRLQTEISCWPDARLRLTGFFQYRRQGEGGLDVPFDTTYLSYTVDQGYDEPFPTGTVERTYTAGFQLWAWRHQYLQLDGVIGYDWIRNVGNVAGKKDEGMWGRAMISLRLERLIRN